MVVSNNQFHMNLKKIDLNQIKTEMDIYRVFNITDEEQHVINMTINKTDEHIIDVPTVVIKPLNIELEHKLVTHGDPSQRPS